MEIPPSFEQSPDRYSSFHSFVETFIPILKGALGQIEQYVLDGLTEGGNGGSVVALPNIHCALVSVKARQASTLAASARHQLIGLTAGQVRVNRYRQVRDGDPCVLDRTLRLDALPAVDLDVAAVEAWRDVVELVGTGLVLILQSPPLYSVDWIYDRQTLTPIGLVAATPTLARIEEGLEILSHLGKPEDATVCVSLAQHPAHAIRWTAIQTAYALDEPLGRNLLQAAVNDPHPEIREAASGIT